MKIRVYFKSGGEILVIGKWAENFYVNLVASAESKFPFVDINEGMAIAIDSIEMYTTHLEEEAEWSTEEKAPCGYSLLTHLKTVQDT